jgi:hypothetical protein
VPSSRTTSAVILVAGAALLASLSGCGFIAAGNKSSIKPSGFVLTGEATVTLPAGQSATVGSPCAAPSGATDVAQDVTVTVSDPAGKKIATGTLGSGVITGSGSDFGCSFPFQIPAVPGNDASYAISIGSRPAQTFAGPPLRESTAAVVTITP